MPIRILRNAFACWRLSGLKGLAIAVVAKLSWPILSPEAYKSVIMYMGLGYWPNIRRPRTFNEKVAHRQLFAPHPLSSVVADKWRVRQYVAERGLASILNEVYFVTDRPEEIPFDSLPERFVIKANHGRGWNMIVKDKSRLDRQEVVRQCREWLCTKYGRTTRNFEMHYDRIEPKILVERLLSDDEHEVPLDYKIDCFHGRAGYIDVIQRGANGRALSVYDRNWTQTEHSYGMSRGEAVPRPAKLELMIEAAETLSSGFDFCRVDLYLLTNETLVFGEITMNPQGGLRRFPSRRADLIYGEPW